MNAMNLSRWLALVIAAGLAGPAATCRGDEPPAPGENESRATGRFGESLGEVEAAARGAKRLLEAAQAQADKELRELQGRIAEESKTLIAQRDAAKKLGEKLQRLQLALEEADSKSRKLTQSNSAARENMSEARSALYAQIGGLKERLTGSLATAQDEQLLDALGNLRQNPSQALPEQVDAFFEACERVLGYARTSAVIQIPVRVAEAEDRIEDLKVLRMGLLGGYYSRPAAASAGFVFADPTSSSGFVAESHGLTIQQKKAISSLLQKPDAGGFLPLDVTGGSAIAALRVSQTPASWLKQGGLWLWTVLGLGAFGVLVALERAVVIGSRFLAARRCDRKVAAMLRMGRAPAGASSQFKGATGRVFQVAIEASEKGRLAMESAVQEALLRHEQALKSRLHWIALAGSAAAFVGFLGTVTAMISTLKLMGLESHSAPAILSAGLGEALVTTQAGLAAVAVCLVLRGFLEGISDSISTRMDAALLNLWSVLLPAEEESIPTMGARV